MICESYSVVVPAYQASATLPDCLAALAAASPAPAEVIVYDDGSTDGTGEIARRAGARVIRNDGPNLGPACGRNAGVRAASSPVVLFVDADVAVMPDAPGRLAGAVAGERDVAAAFGAYGDKVSTHVRNVAGAYANLRHHHTHAEAGGRAGPVEAQTFWSGLGAVDRAAFLRAGGFDEGYARPCIEDVELGLRLREGGGRVLLVPGARGDHMKDWTLAQLWRTDLFCRALPWSQLAAAGRIAPTLNTGKAEQAKSVLAHAVWILAVAALAALAVSVPLAAAFACVGAAAMLAYLRMNRRFLRLLARRSPATALGGAGLHWLYHCYASATYAMVLTGAGFGTAMRRRGSGTRNASRPAALS